MLKQDGLKERVAQDSAWMLPSWLTSLLNPVGEKLLLMLDKAGTASKVWMYLAGAIMYPFMSAGLDSWRAVIQEEYP